MAQKLVLCEGTVGADALNNPLVNSLIANGGEIKAISGFSTPNNRNMCFVLLSVPDPTVESESESEGEESGALETVE